MNSPLLLGLALAAGAPNLKDKDTAGGLVGDWEVESVTNNGTKTPAGPGLHYTFTEDGKWLISRNGRQAPPTITRQFVIDGKPNPPTVDLVTARAGGQHARLIGIYKIDGDTLLICGTRAKDGDRPTKFEAPEGSGNVLYVLKRPKKE